jgi:hypothetical protein
MPAKIYLSQEQKERLIKRLKEAKEKRSSKSDRKVEISSLQKRLNKVMLFVRFSCLCS